MRTVIVVVGYHQHAVFPYAVVGVGCVGQQFVDHLLGFQRRFHRHTSHCYAHPVAVEACTAVVVEKCQDVVGVKRCRFVLAVVRLPCQQFRETLRPNRRCDGAVVVRCTAKQQHVAQTMAIGGRLATVVVHFQHPAVCINVGSAR